MRIGGSGGEVVGDLPPAVHLLKIDGPAGVVGPEDDLRLREIVRGIQGVLRRTDAAGGPEIRRTFHTVNDAATVGVGVPPIRAGQVLKGVRDAVAVEIVGQDVVRGVVLRVGPVEVLVKVVHAT